jgi:alkaline phosphatase
VAREAQASGWGVGIVTSVPVSHATPAAAYANNVTRRDYQDLSRDLLGLPSVAHPDRPLAGVDVLLGAGAGVERDSDPDQGANFVPGNRYLAASDLQAIDAAEGGPYVIAMREEGVDGGALTGARAEEAARGGKRLFGFFGTDHGTGHLPYRTADGDYRPVEGYRSEAEVYTDADLIENPTLAEMTQAALTVLERNPNGFWLMVEAGDVDWASHEANIDNTIGAVFDGDAAVRVITDWVERHSDWQESLLIVTADHGHYLVVADPAGLCN